MIRSCVMSSNGFVTPIEIRPARLFALTYLSLQGGAAALASMLTPIPAAPRLLLCSAVLLMSMQAIRRYSWRQRHRRLILAETGEWRLADADGTEHRLELLRRRSFWFAWLVGLSFRRERTLIRVWVTPRSAGPDNWRLLQTRLRFP